MNNYDKIKKKILIKFGKKIRDDKYLKKIYKLTTGYELDLENPKTFNEKIQWLKINDRNPEYTKLVDKGEVKNYVADIIGKEYIISTIGIYNSFDEINFDELPNKFVIKCTHDSGSVIICKDKKTFDINKARKKIKKCQKQNYYYKYREWVYKNVKPRIIIEKYMEDFDTKDIRDYKFFVFSGKVKIMYVASNRNKNGDTYFDFFDEKFNHLNIKNCHPNNPSVIAKPREFEKMKKYAEKLSNQYPFVRVDFYEINNKVYFGEMTFYHMSGLAKFEPNEWDYKLGKLLNIHSK